MSPQNIIGSSWARYLLFFGLAGYVPAQNLPAIIQSQYPPSNARGIARNTGIALHFVANVSVTGTQVSLRQNGSSTNIAVRDESNYNQAGTDLVVKPVTPLAANTSYTVTLAHPSVNYQFSFTTGSDLDTTSPRLVSITPDPNSGAVDPAGPFLFQFDEPLLTPFVNAGLGTGFARLSTDRRTVILTNLPQYRLPSVLNVVFEPAHVRDICGNTLAASIRTRFLTTVGRDLGALRLVGHYPEAGETNVPTGSVISLLFSHEISSYERARGIVVEARGQPVALQASADGSVVLLTGFSLLPNTTYTVRVNSELVDSFGLALDQPSSFEFTTAAAPTTYPSDEVRIGPQYNQTSAIPSNTRIVVRSPRPLPTYTPLLFENTIPLLNPLPGREPLKSSAVLQEDRRVLVITPAVPFDRTNPSHRFPGVFDVEGRKVLSDWSATITLRRDDEPPRIVSSTPSAQSSGAPINTAIRIKFNETIGLMTPSTAVRLLKDGVRWPGATVITDTVIDFKTAEPLLPESEYTIELEGVADVAGNVMPTESITFRSGADSTVPTLLPRLLRSSLEDGDPDPSATIELEYSQPLRSGFSSAAAMVFVSRPNNSPLQFDHPVRLEVDGATLRISPLVPWPSERDVTLYAGSEDLWGRVVNYTATLRAKRSSDTVRPEVISISPPPGTPFGAGDRIVLTFSEPMLNASQVDAIFGVQSGRNVLGVPVWSDDRRSLTLSPSNITLQTGPLDTITFVATSALVDLAGNPLVPLVARFPVASRAAVSSLPSIVASIPLRNSNSTLDPGSPLTLILSRPVSAADLNRALWVYTNAGHTAGTWEVSSDGLVAAFRPQVPWPAGSPLRLFQTEQVVDLTYSFEASITPSRSPTLHAIRTTFVDNVHPANKVIEIEFSQDLPAQQPGPVVLTALNGTTIQYDEVEIRPRVRRFVPKTTIPVGTVLTFTARSGSPVVWQYAPQARVAAPLEPQPVGTVYRSPADRSQDVPRNARISLVLQPLLNPLSVADSTVSILANGRRIPARYSIDTNSRGPLQITPQELLPPDTEIQVSLDGLTDLIGQKIGPYQWTFRTGNAVDLTPPKLLYSSLPAGVSIVPFVLEPSAQVRLFFDEPIDPASVALFVQSSGEPGRWEFSEDFRTISRRVPDGVGVSMRTPQVTDVSGNSFSDNGTVYVGFENTRSPLVLRGVSIRDGQTGLPLNVKIGLLFDRLVGTDALAGIRLMRGSESIRLGQVSSTPQGRVSFGPDAPLDPNTEYQLVVDGVQDASGNRLAEARVIRFTTGESYDNVAPVGTFRFLSRALPLRVRFSEPLDETSLAVISRPLAYNDSSGAYWIAKASVELSADLRDVTVIPQQELQTGLDYTMDLSGVSDFAGFTTQATFRFRVVDNPDTSAPRIRVYPPDGTANVPTNASMLVLFSRVTDTPPLRLYENDKLVLTVPSRTTTNVPLQRTLKPSSQYRIEADGFRDEFGNDVPPLISSFSTGTADDRTLLEFVSASPANGAAGVPVDSPWKITFNKILSPTVLPEFYSTESRQFPYSVSSEAVGNQLVVQPKPAWPAAYSLQLTLPTIGRTGLPSVQDLAGNRLRTPLNFTMRTAAVSDSTPPVLESVTPAPGTLLSGTQVTIALRFSEPVSTGNAVQVYYGAQLTSASGIYSSDLRTVTYTLRPPANSRVTIIGTDGIRDNGDNPIAPFVLEYPTGEAPLSGSPSLLRVDPYSWTEITPTTTPLIRFDRAMNSDSVIRALRVTESNLLISGTVEVLADARDYRFKPNAPFKAGTEIRLFLISEVVDVNDRALERLSYGPYSQIATYTVPGPKPLSILQRGFESIAPADSILEVEFDREIDRTSVHADSVWLREGSRLVPGYASLRDDRILQFTPAVPLESGIAYVLTAGAALRGLDGSEFAGQDLPFRAGPQAEHAEIESVEPAEWEGRPAVRVRFTAPVSPLAARSLRIERDGRTEASTKLRSTDAREVWLVPSSPAPGALAIGMDWVPGRNGRPIAGRRLPVAIGGGKK